MLFISIMMVIWFGVWLFFAWQRHEALGVIAAIMCDIHKQDYEKGAETDDSDS